MKRTLLRVVAVCLILSGVAVSGFLYRQLGREQEATARLTEALRAAEASFSQLKQRYAAANARVTVLSRAELMAKAKARKAMEQIGALEAERQALADEKAALSLEGARRTEALEKAVQQLSGEKEKLVEARARLADESKALARDLRSKSEELSRVIEAKRQIETALGEKSSEADRYLAHNKKLSEVAAELIDQYRNKSFRETLLAREPFTGIKQVEIENLLETYLDRIERHIVRED